MSSLPTSPAPPAQAPRELPFTLLFGAVAAVLLLGLQLVEPYFFLRDDNATHFLPAYTYSYESLIGAGELPLLNQHQFLGNTFLAAGQTGVFLAVLYPIAALLRLGGSDPRSLIDALASLHLLLGGVGMWRLLRHLGVRQALAFPLALGWCFLPFGVLVARSWVFVTYTMAFLPWNCWALLRFLDKPSGRRGIALVLLKTLFLLTGYVQYMVIASFFELVFLGIFFWRERGRTRAFRQALAVAAIFSFTALLAAPLALPLLHAKEVSAERAERLPTRRALSFSLSPADFVRTQLLAPREKALFGHGPTSIYFLGLPLLLALWGAIRRRRELGAISWAALLAGLFALAMSTLLYYLLYLTPLFAALRWPFKNFPVAAFFLLVAAALAAHSFAATSPRRAHLAILLAWLNFGMQLSFFLVPAWRHPFGPHRLDRAVAALREAPLLRQISADGRAIAVSSAADAPLEPSSLRLGFLYATLAGKYHLAGYDPLLAQLNNELAPPTSANTELVFPPAAWPAIRASLVQLSGRYLLVSAHSELVPTLAADPALRRLGEQEETLLFELTSALPIVLHLDTRAPLPFRWRTNGLELDLPADFAGGRLLFNLAGLQGYEFALDGVNQGTPDFFEKRPLLTLPPGAHHLELRYRDPFFVAGTGLALLGLLLLLLVLRADARLERYLLAAAPDAQNGLAEGIKK